MPASAAEQDVLTKLIAQVDMKFAAHPNELLRRAGAASIQY
jgi:hypothetical protein